MDTVISPREIKEKQHRLTNIDSIYIIIQQHLLFKIYHQNDDRYIDIGNAIIAQR